MKRPNMPSPLKSAGSAVLSSPTHRPTAGEVGPADVTGQLLSALLAYKAGDFCVRLPSDWTGVPGKIADAFNEVPHLGLIPVRECLLGQGAGPSEINISLLDYITGRFRGE